MDQLRSYASLLSGQIGRLVFSMIYFITLAKTLSLGDFGLFATASAIGIVLSRMTGLGFISPLFRIATTKPSLLGIYTCGFLAACFVSVPVLLLLAWGIFELLYANLIDLQSFMLIIAAEVVFWRALEATIIVNNGLNRYLLASSIAIAGVAVKAAAALFFMFGGATELNNWALAYFSAQGAFTFLAILLFYPKNRLRWKPKAWILRLKDALSVSAAEALFYVQSELDKVLVLILGGEVLAGIYAIVMRLVDLTAMPMRALTTMLTQWIMRARKSGKGAQTGLKLDGLIMVVSIVALIGVAVLLAILPNVLGKNIALGASFLWLVLLVPGFRNAIELHTDLLYGHERMGPRIVLLVYIGTLKAFLLTILLSKTQDFATVAIWLNAVFAILYFCSAHATYGMILKQKLNPSRTSASDFEQTPQ